MQGNGDPYPTNAAAQSNFTVGVTPFTTNPNKTTITLQTMDTGWVSHTKTQFIDMYNNSDAWKEALYKKLTRLIAIVMAATTVSAV